MGHHDVDGLGDRGDNRLDRGEVLEARRVEDVGARGFKCLQASDRIIEVGSTVDEVFCPCGQNEGDGQSPRHLD